MVLETIRGLNDLRICLLGGFEKHLESEQGWKTCVHKIQLESARGAITADIH